MIGEEFEHRLAVKYFPTEDTALKWRVSELQRQVLQVQTGQRESKERWVDRVRYVSGSLEVNEPGTLIRVVITDFYTVAYKFLRPVRSNGN